MGPQAHNEECGWARYTNHPHIVLYYFYIEFTGLNILLTQLQMFSKHDAGPEFFKAYFLDLMQHVFAVVTDTSHTASGSLLH